MTPNTRYLLPLVVASTFVISGCGDDSSVEKKKTTTNEAPFVTTSMPAEGASEVDIDLSTVTIVFNEPMDQSAGTLSIDGGASLGTPSWAGETLTVSVTGLVLETSYSLVLTGFVDEAGAALDGAAYLGDGALDFSTAPAEEVDTTPPIVTDADPNEAQVDVALDLASISVTFDEPMDTTLDQVVLVGGPTDVDLTGSWDASATSISFALSGSLEFSTDYYVDLSGYADVSGNALDGATYLGDGVLDFSTIDSVDARPPVVVASDPTEAAINLDPDTSVITLSFSEDMDASITALPLTEGVASPVMVNGAWSDGDTLFTINLTSFLTAGEQVHLDVTGMADEAGNLLDASDPYLMDGILDFSIAAAPTGESCTDPLVLSQSVENMGAYTWDVPGGAVVSADGEFACDGSGAGSDVVVRYVKTSDTLANGGELLHVAAVGGTDDINLEITSGDCSAALGTVESCLWFKESWDKFLDVPAGTYWIWVSDDDTAGSFPGATITVEEIPASAPQAQGEGCFAPYDTASANYAAPPTANDPHVWTIPASINGFEIAPSSASVGSISCDDHPTYGDIHGVDAVVEFQKMSASTVLLIEVNNLDPTLTQSDLDVEVLTGCDTLAPMTTSIYCGANADNFAFTASADVGPVYVWVSSEATGEEFNGAEVAIREFTPALGETIASAEPLTMSGDITPTSTAGLDRPSCFPVPGNVHWYSYTTTGTLFGVQGDAAAPIAVVDGSGELACSLDTTGVAIGKNVPAGTTVYIAVESPSAIGNLTIIDQTYTGLAGSVTNLNITFPTSATTEYSMAVGANEIFMGSTSEIWSFSKAGNDTAVEHNAGDGLGAAQLGYSIAFAAGRLFSVDSTTSTTLSRLFAVHDQGAMTWGPTAWDTPVNYPASTPVYAMTSDGSDLIMVSRETVATEPLVFMSVPAAAPATATVLGSYTGVYYVTGIAADASYIYVVGRLSTIEEHLFRFDRSNLSAAPTVLAAVNANTLQTNVVVDNLAAANHVYVRDDDTVLHAIVDPGVTPIYIGGLLTDGGAADYAMAMDQANSTMYMFDSTLAANGGVIAVQ